MADTDVKAIKNPVTLRIDDREVTVEKDTVIIEAARQIGIEVPYFCWHPKLKPDANCRMCLVEVEKMPKLQTACSTPVAPGMVVRTNNARAVEAQKGVMEFILANHPLDCPICDQGGECELQDRSHRYSDQYSRFEESKRRFEKDYFSPLIEKEMNRCIQCMRCVRYCDEVVDLRAIVPIQRGSHTEIGTFDNRHLDCEFCGGCVQICPVGAFVNRVTLYDYRPWQLKKTETVCSYCADGCTLNLETVQGRLERVTSDWSRGRNQGDLCPRGYFGFGTVNSPARLTRPLLRTGSELAERPWLEVIEWTGRRLSDIKARYGGEAIGGVISARCTNEDAYVFQKFMRLALGSPNVDSSARYGLMNGIRAMLRVGASGGMMNRYEDMVQAQAILLVGSDITHTNPITGFQIKRAVRRNGARLIGLGPFLPEIGPVSNIANRATDLLTVRAGAEGAGVLGWIKVVIDRGLVHPDIQRSYPEFVSSATRAAATISYEAIERACGLKQADLAAAAEAFGRADRAVIVVGHTVSRAAGGYRVIMNLVDLAALTGKLGRPGCGVNVLGEENNELGVVEMGAAPEFLPGWRRTGNVDEQAAVASFWQEETLPQGGMDLGGMLQAAREGRLKALVLVGENPLGTLPPSSGVAEALGRLELLVCQEMFLTPTAAAAHAVFPAASYAEKEGTFTNHEGIRQRVRRALDPPGDAAPDWEIAGQLAAVIGFPLEYDGGPEIGREIDRLFKAGPAKGDAAASEYLRRGFAEDLPGRYRPPDPPVEDPQRPFRLLVGQVLFHSGKLSLESKALMQVAGEPMLGLHPADADRLGISDGDRVRILSARGEAVAAACRMPRIPSGVVFFPEHFSEPAVAALADIETDPDTGVIGRRLEPVSVERV